MKKSKYGIPHAKDGAHLLKAAHGEKPKADVPSMAEAVMGIFDLADQGKISFSHPVEAKNDHELRHQIAGLTLSDNQVFVGFRVRGDLRANGLPPISESFPNGQIDLPVLKELTYKALVCHLTGKLEMGELHQADTKDDLHALPGQVDLSAHDDAFLGFVRTEN